MYDFVYKNDKYDILGFTIKEKQIEEYKYDLIIGNKKEITTLFNINNKLLGIDINQYYPISNYKVIVNTNFLYVLDIDKLYIIDIENFRLKYNINLELYAPLDEIHIFNNGILICGEIDVVFIKDNKIIWSYDSPSWFSNYEIIDDKIKLTVGETNKKIILDSNGKEI